MLKKMTCLVLVGLKQLTRSSTCLKHENISIFNFECYKEEVNPKVWIKKMEKEIKMMEKNDVG